MGIGSSKRKRRSVIQTVPTIIRPLQVDEETETASASNLQPISKKDEEVIRVIKKDLNEDPEIDFMEISQKLFEPQEIIKLDLVLNKINENVRYRPFHGTKKGNSEAISSTRIYPINNKIEVIPAGNEPKSDKDIFKVLMEDSKRKGYVKLKGFVEEDNQINNSYLNVPEIKETTPTPSASSTDNEPDPTYAYATITNIRTPKPIEFVKELPNANPEIKSCCVYRRYNKKEQIDEDKDLSEITEDDLLETVLYLSSRRYMKLVETILFPNEISSSLGFHEGNIESLKTMPGKLFCNQFEKKDSFLLHEILPALRIPWPDYQTYLFQGAFVTGQLSWPTSEMVDKIKQFDCTLVPTGYFKKRGDNPEADLEWEIHFPKADSYLESCMTHAQIRCFIFMLILHKTYINEVTEQNGLLAEHIKTHMFWECANNFNQWPEHRLGIKLVDIINNFLKRLRKYSLKDFFIRDRNLFQNIPRKYLEHANKTFHDILQAPLMYFIRFLRNVRYYSSGHFYPPLDFGELKRLLAVSRVESNDTSTPLNLINTPIFVKRIYPDKDTQLEHLRELENRKRMWEKRQKMLEAEKLNLKGVEERRGSVDSIDTEWKCEKRFDLHRKSLILEFFINNFLNIAQKSAKIGSTKQTLFYLKQAWYLSKILEEECAFMGHVVKELLIKINDEMTTCKLRQRAPRNDIQVEVLVNGVEKPSEKPKQKINSPTNKPRKSVAFAQSEDLNEIIEISVNT